MTRLKVSFLGSWQVIHAKKGNLSFQGRKAVALLAYLVLEKDEAHNREELAKLFWPDLPEENARNNLRVALARINKQLGTSKTPFTVKTKQAVKLNQRSDYWCDVIDFRELINTTKQHNHEARSSCPKCQPQLVKAGEIYKGDFLEGFQLENCPDFEKWQLEQRQYFKEEALQLFNDLSNHYSAAGNYETAKHYTKKQLDLDPLCESAYRQIMRLLYYQNRRPDATAQFQACQEILAKERGVEPEDETLALYHQITSGTLAIELPLETASQTYSAEALQPRNHNLPEEVVPFLGREEELQEATKFLAKSCLLTIVGLGGSGKTRLALEVARTQLKNFADGVFLVKLAPLQDTSGIVGAVAEAINYTFRQEKAPKLELLEFLQNKSLLLIMDNFEHLFEGMNLITEILQGAAKVKFLVTSRQKLSLSSETAYLLEGMAYPKESGDWENDKLLNYSGVQLFLHTAKRTRLNFKPATDELKCIAFICKLVQGIPLAIVLAASWVDTLSPTAIANDLKEGLDLLEKDLSDFPTRQRSMQATFNYSWQLLSQEEQISFARISIFRGNFTRQAAREVTGASLQILNSLINKSLIQHRIDKAYYEIHELTHQLAKERLDQLGQITEVQNAHCIYYLNELTNAEKDLARAAQKEALKNIEDNFENIRAAWQWALRGGKLEQIKKALSSLSMFFRTGKRLQDAMVLFEAALNFIRTLPKTDTNAKHELDLLLALVLPYQVIKGAASPELELLLTRSQELCEQLGDIYPLSITFYGLWSFYLVRAEHLIALNLAKRSLAIVKEQQNSGILLAAEQMNAISLHYLGKFSASQTHCEQILAIYDPQKHHAMSQVYNFDLGVQSLLYSSFNLWFLGYSEQALNKGNEAIALARSLGHTFSLAIALECNSSLYFFRQEPQDGYNLAVEQLELATKHQLPFYIALANFKLGWVLTENGQEDGLVQMQQILAGYKSIGKMILPFLLGWLAKAYIGFDRLQETNDLLDEAEKSIDATNECFWEAEVQRLKGEVLLKQGKPEAEQHFRKAIKIAQAQQAKSLELRAVASLSHLLKQQNKSKEAKQILSEIYGWFTEGFNTVDIKKAKRLMESF